MSHRRPRSISVPLQQLEPLIWEIPKEFKPSMRVPGRVYAPKSLITKMSQDRTLVQCSNVASLPGIQKYALTLPDGHKAMDFLLAVSQRLILRQESSHREELAMTSIVVLDC